MSNEAGRGLRAAFLELLAEMGTECDVRKELRRAVKQSEMKEGYVVFQFPDEFALEVGDRIRETTIEGYFDVVDMKPISSAGVFNHFEVTTEWLF
jgi:hypothetical protein